MRKIYLNIINQGSASIRIHGEDEEKKENTLLTWLKKIAGFLLD